jgi:signal transduction histidine kinase
MNAIMGMMQVVNMRGVPDNIKGCFDTVSAASHTLMSLIDDLLDVSSMEYGVFKLSESVFNTKEVFLVIVQTTEYNASLKKQVFKFKADPEVPQSLLGDEKRLKQVISNLLANAVKYTPERGEICLDARVVSEEDTTVTLQFDVSDNGIGIPAGQQTNLFTIFEQVDGGYTRKHGGIGLGLALSKRIVEMMGGEIWVESEPDKGAKFSFTCKLKKVQ